MSARGKIPTPQLTKRNGGSLLWFPEHSDRLLCDPTNCLHCYGVVDFKYASTEAECRAQVEKLIVKIMRIASLCYQEALDVYENLPSENKKRVVMQHVPPPVLPLIQGNTRGADGSLTGRRTSRRGMRLREHRGSATVPPSLAGSISEQSPLMLSTTGSESFLSPTARRRGSKRKGAKDSHGDDTVAGRPRKPSAPVAPPVRTAEQLESDVYQLLVSDWPAATAVAQPQQLAVADDNDNNNDNASMDASPLSPRSRGLSFSSLRVKIFIDIVASRKTIGTDPANSRPYRLGEYVYKYIHANYIQNVSAVCVGISDANVKLMCRDILFPFRHAPVGPANSSSSGKAKSRALEGGAWDADGINQPGSAPSALDVFRSGSMLSCVRLPPIAVNAIDQCRLIVCFPKHEVF